MLPAGPVGDVRNTRATWPSGVYTLIWTGRLPAASTAGPTVRTTRPTLSYSVSVSACCPVPAGALDCLSCRFGQ